MQNLSNIAAFSDIMNSRTWRPKGWLHRLGRRVFWPQPALYRWVASLRDRFIPQPRPGLFWVGGYPRSSNTFTAHALKHCFHPDEEVDFHLHLPPQILILHKARCPGILVLREPLPAAISYCQLLHLHQRGARLVEALRSKIEYYIDFHRALSSVAPALFIAAFEDTTRDIRHVLQSFFAAMDLPRAVPPLDVQEVCTDLERLFLDSDGKVDELAVARPSANRTELRTRHWLKPEVVNHPRVLERLREAEEIYGYFHSFHHRLKGTTREAI